MGPRGRLRAAVFLMGGLGHFARMRGLIAALAAQGVEVDLFTDRVFAGEARACGARFHDLYAGRRRVESLDDSRPRPTRQVTFAALYGEELARATTALGPSLVIADSHAVVGQVVAQVLELPYVCVRPGHDVDPTDVDFALRDPRLALSERCHESVGVLAERFGIEAASPFLYFTATSPLLNIYCEPEQYLSEATRAAIEPVGFLGSLSPPADLPQGSTRRDGIHVYVSFGTVVWVYWQSEALAALEEVAASVEARNGVTATISLGGADLPPGAVRRLRRRGVKVERFVDQWRLLSRSHLFVTHNGLNSTHEAIYLAVPMLSYPFNADQPRLAAKVQRFGLALPLATEPRAPIHRSDVDAALDTAADGRAALLEAHEQARAWELEVVRRRPELVGRIIELMESHGAGSNRLSRGAQRRAVG
jgi:UDP:flavonoid glycosyltransferase YjiC (YdhE family)